MEMQLFCESRPSVCWCIPDFNISLILSLQFLKYAFIHLLIKFPMGAYMYGEYKAIIYFPNINSLLMSGDVFLLGKGGGGDE